MSFINNLVVVKESKKYIKKIAIIICCIGIFITGTILRYGVYDISVLEEHSPLLYVGLFLIFITQKSDKKELSKNKIDKKGLYIYLPLIICAFFVINSFNSWKSYIRPYVILIAFTIIILYRFQNKKDLKEVFNIWMIFCRVCIILMFTTEIIDFFTDNMITKIIANFTNIKSLKNMVEQGRSVTYMGHSLFSSQIFLVYYLFANLEKKINNKKTTIIDFVICTIGIALCQGRASLVLLFMAFIIFNILWKQPKKIVIGIILTIIMFFLGIFDGIIMRTIGTIEKGDISSGRHTAIQELTSKNELVFEWSEGQRVSTEPEEYKIRQALEYPILGWAYIFGIFITVLLVAITFIYPLLIVIKRKQPELFFALFLLILNVNSYSGLCTVCDKPIFYFCLVCIILNVSNLLYVEEIYKTEEKEEALF